MRRLVLVFLAAFALVLAALATFVSASGDPAIHACVNPSGSLRVLSAGDSCRSSETSLDWSITGPAGPTGATGPQGATGAPGRDGTTTNGLPHQVVIGRLTVHGVTGENADGSMDVLGYSLGVTVASSVGGGGGGGAGRPTFDKVTVTKEIDKASPTLMQKTVTGVNVADVQLDIYSPGTTTVVITYKLTHDVAITSYQPADDGHVSELPTETISFDFAAIEIIHPSTNTRGGFDITLGRAL
jgi:type VI secretion system secreted protein Hcp